MSSNICNTKNITFAVLGTAAAGLMGYILYKKFFKQSKNEEQSKKEEEKELKPNVIFLLGGPGSGKGTQSKFLEGRYHWIPISAGDCLREEQATDSKDAELIRDYIKNGKIVPGEITINLLWKKIQKYASEGYHNIIIDGFPRSMENLEGWNTIVECSEAVMTERVMNRAKSSGRTDDNPEALIKRFKTHNETSKPVIELFEQQGMVRRINADQTIEQVSNDIAQLFENEVHC